MVRRDHLMEGNVTLTACLIVKDEADVLPRCLESLKPAVDEIVVVDTGSRDDSRQIAHGAGARVLETPWTGDFSRARNVALDAARSDWILVVDADEWFERREDALALRHSVPPHPAGGRIRLINHLDGNRRQSVGLLRVMPRHPAIRFEGRVHEQVTGPLERAGWPTVDVGGVLQHDGYLTRSVQRHDKLSRNLHLLEETLRERPDDLEARYHLGKTLNLLGRQEEAEKAFERVVLAPHQEHRRHLVNRAWVFRAELACLLRGVEAGREVLAERGPSKAWPVRVALLAARWDLESRAFATAIERVAPVVNEDPQLFDDPWDAPALRHEAAMILARGLDGLGRAEEAWQTLAPLAGTVRPDDGPYWLLLATLSLRTGRREHALDMYERVLTVIPDHLPSWLALGTLLIELGRAPEATERLARARGTWTEAPDLDLLLGLARRLS
jgi:tetratricopeptide (TPR) repeat protein